jgi:D-arabinose 1-dehydrogenase-like Zn-dependent alcohol dehydrogenase
MMGQIDAWVAPSAEQKLVRQLIDLGPLGDEEVEVRVEHCGLCHSDPSMLGNDWGWSRFPAMLGHEAVGTVVEVGRAAKGVKVGQKVGVGLTAVSCMHFSAVPVGRAPPVHRGRADHSRASRRVRESRPCPLGLGHTPP